MIKKELKEKLDEIRKDPASNKLLAGAYQILLADIQNDEIKEKRELTDDEVISIIKKDIRQNKERKKEALSFERDDAADFANLVIESFSEFIPSQLDYEQILSILNSQGAKKDMKMGQLMGIVMKDNKSRVDGTLVRKVIEDNFLN